MKKLNVDFRYLIFLWVILGLAIIPTYAHYGNLIVDSGREAYIPTQVLLGKVLYKDIFNIYGPFSYMFNAVLFKIFGINLNVLYMAGIFCLFCTGSLIYLIAKRFLPAFLSFSCAVYTVLIGALTINLFNFVFPYSYGMLYGVVSFLASVFFLLKYTDSANTKFLYLSSFFAGLCIASKYEFLPYLIVLLYAVIKVKPLKLKEYYYTVFLTLFIPVFCFGILFLQGLGIKKLALAVLLLFKMSQATTLKYFYHSQGVYFDKRTPLLLLSNFFKTAVPFLLFIFALKPAKKIISFVLIPVSIFLMMLWVSPLTFSFFPFLIFAIVAFRFKKLKDNTPLLILALSSILFSLKVFWGMATLNYGIFFAGFSLVTLLALIADFLKEKDINFNAVGIYVLAVGILLNYHNIVGIVPSFWPMKFNQFAEKIILSNFALSEKKYLISEERGQIYTNKSPGVATKDLIDYIRSNTKTTDAIIILPEGAMVNFFTKRNGDNYMLSLIPLYIETFGEDNIIKRFQKTKPEYVIFNSWVSVDYYYHQICADYALNLCGYVMTNYSQTKRIDKDGFTYVIFKRKR